MAAALDASALIALLRREPGHERVEPVLDSALLSTVNLAEVLSIFARDGFDAVELSARIKRLPIEIVPFAERHAAIAAALMPVTRPLGLSLGDRVCLALAQARGVGALTADRSWRRLKIGVEIEAIR
jgi:PIN domain nuclease of toxin-antitoxin system